MNFFEVPIQKTESLCSSFFLYSLLFFTLVGCDNNTTEVVQVHGRTMGTTYSVKVVAPKSQLPEKDLVKRWADKMFEGINQSMSTYIADSELSVLNRSNQADWQHVSRELYEVLKLSQEVSEASGGAFDVTVAPLVDAWGFGPKARPEKIPSEKEIADTLKNIGSTKLTLGDGTAGTVIRKPAGLSIDLSAVAKGYAADALAAKLREKGYTDYMVEVGGELALGGKSPSGTSWTIGIETPSYQFGQARQAENAVRLSDKGMATSGDYRNYYEEDGKRYSHTIDPRTGMPIDHALASVTVIADTCAEADAWATALNVVGPEDSMALAEREGLAAYFIVKKGEGFESTYSKAFRPYLLED